MESNTNSQNINQKFYYYNFPKIMGIMNATPDSFSDNGKYFNIDEAIKHCMEMISDGADIIDIGGESTRPGSNSISAEEEIKRIIPIVEKIRSLEPNIPISIDTTKSQVAEAALIAGANIINDISGLTFDPALAGIIAKYKAEVIIMHIKGEPRSMQNNPTYDNVVQEVYDFLKNQIAFAQNAGIKKIYADIGIGFGKSIEHNFELLRNIDTYYKLDVPLLLGISRKSFIGKTLDIDIPNDRDAATALLHSLLLNQKIDIIRVHNVKLHSQLRDLFYELNY